MTKEHNVLEIVNRYAVVRHTTDIDSPTYSFTAKNLTRYIDALTKPLEEKINHWVIMTNTYADNLELHKAKIAELEARIAEQQKELDDCKDAVVMLREELKPYSHYGVIGSRDVNTKRIQLLLSATSAIVEGYKK